MPTETTPHGKDNLYQGEQANIPLDYIARNKLFWKNARRGVLSRPMEIPAFLSESLHRRITTTFGLDQAEKPTVVWSVVFDNPESPNSQYVYERRFPDDVPVEERTNYAAGIDRITEYASNLATREFIRRNTDIPILRTFSKGYRILAEMATYGLLLNGTYRRLMNIETLAKGAGRDFTGAVLDGLFDHDFEPINKIMADTADFSGCANIDELAIDIGRKRFKLNIGSALGKLETEKTDGVLKSTAKNAAISVAAAGVFRTPGVVELSAAMLPLSVATGFAVSEVAINSEIIFGLHRPALMLDPQIPIALMPTALETLATMALTLAPLAPFIAIHEAIHHYSGGEDYLGFTPVNLIAKEVTPYKAKFAGE